MKLGVDRLSYAMAVRTAKQGLLFGAGFGVLQDVLRVVKGEGEDVKYLKWLPRRQATPEETTPSTDAKL